MDAGKLQRLDELVEKARQDWKIVCAIAERLGGGDKFRFQAPVEIFAELRRLSAGGIADYAGITYERIEQEMGVFWPCPDPEHPGTPRLFEGGRFGHADGKARFHAIEYRPLPRNHPRRNPRLERLQLRLQPRNALILLLDRRKALLKRIRLHFHHSDSPREPKQKGPRQPATLEPLHRHPGLDPGSRYSVEFMIL